MNFRNMVLKFIIPTAVLLLVIWHEALAAENPDELYKQQRFAEAERVYNRLAGDHPKDVRYRYNQGCAAYQVANYPVARDAFSSVLQRAENDQMRFKAVYNLGNIAYQQADFSSAISYFRQALRYNSMSDDARYNLELALRALQKQKKEPAGKKNRGSQKRPSKAGEKEEPANSLKNKKDDHRQRPKTKPTHPEPSQKMDHRAHEGQNDSGRRKKSDRENPMMTQKGQKHDQNSTKDLSGRPELLQDLPEGGRKDQISDADKNPMDKKKAAALLENIKENRSRFLRFQIPEKYKKGVRSGKDW